MYTTQSRLFGNVIIYGKHTGRAIEKPTAEYYQLLKMDSHYLAEVPSAVISTVFANRGGDDYGFDYYWLQFSPPLPGKYQLTINIDFANCQGSLQDTRLGITKRKDFESFVPKSGNSATDQYKYTQGDAYCEHMLLAPGVVKLEMDVQESSDEQTVEAAKVFRENMFCDLSSLSGAYWVYPAQYMAMPVARLLRDFDPIFHHPNCPSFSSILRSLHGKSTMCLNGDSNVVRLHDAMGKFNRRPMRRAQPKLKPPDLYSNNGSRRSLPEVAPGFTALSTQFDHNSHCLRIHGQHEKTSPTINYNIGGYLDRFHFCLKQNRTPVIAQYLGHHLVELTAAELETEVIIPLLKSINDEVAAKAAKFPRKSVLKAQSSRIVFWATIASHARMFYSPITGDTKSIGKNSLIFRSNSYREVLQMEALQRVLNAYNASGNSSDVKYNGDVNKNYVAYLEQRKRLKDNFRDTLQRNAYSYVDMFHPSLALGSTLHSYHDPVHAHDWFFHYVTAALAVQTYCRVQISEKTGNSACLSEEAQADSGENRDFDYLEWHPVKTIPFVHTVKRNIQYDYKVDAKENVPHSVKKV